MVAVFDRSGRFYLLLSLTILILGCSGQESSVVDGISEDLAKKRKSQLSNISYELFFNIPKDKDDSIKAKASINFTLKDLTLPVILDFTADPSLIKSLSVNGQEVKPRIENEHILIDPKYLQKSTLLELDFIAGNQSLNRQKDFLYTLFVPARASSCFPLFDQPDLKATYQLRLNIPDDWEAITNTTLLEDAVKDDRREMSFGESKPISSYLFAFAAGDFQISTKSVGDKTFRMYHRESDSTKVSKNIEAIYQWHFLSLDWLEEYTDIDYPFEKLDFVLIPSFQYGGMEHPGAIFYKASSLMLSESATLKQQLSRAQLIAHEVSHMWFGDLVTMKWFNDVWLKEVFANFMADKIVAPQFSGINRDLNFFMSHYPSAYEVDRTKGTHAIAQPLENLKNAGSLYGSIIYQKAPIVMRKLENYVGEASFQKSMKDYLKKFAYENATWNDLLDILKTNTDKNINQWNQLWVETAGRPIIRYVLKGNDNQEIEKFRTISYSKDEFNQVWPQEVEVAFYWADSSANYRATTGELLQNVEGLKIPEWLYTNADGMGYGYFHISKSSRDSLLNHISEYPPLNRASLWVSFNEMMLENNLPPEILLKALLKNLPKERDELITEYMLDVFSAIYWNLIDEGLRSELANQVEGVLLNLALGSTDNSMQATYFNALQDVAITDGMLDILYKVWEQEMKIEGLVLSEPDYIALSKTLALKHRRGEKIIERQIEQTENEDEKRKLWFIKPAFSNDTIRRDDLFNSFKSEKNRANEEWVLEALKYLHHPLRRNESRKYIPYSLALSKEIQETGDIFFLKRWLDATLSYYNTESDADLVRQYLYKNHRLPGYVKNKVLQSADRLFRYAEIRKKEEGLELVEN